MSGTGTWLLHGHDIGLPLEVDFGVSADISASRVNGAKTQSIPNSVEATSFKVQFLKEFANEGEQKIFRQQMEQLQNGILFMPYLLVTNQFAEELNEVMVNLRNVDMPREAGIVGYMKYEIEFALLGHNSEFRAYTQFRPIKVEANFANWSSRRKAAITYPAGAIFHSDSPTGYMRGEFGNVPFRISPSKNAIFYNGAMGQERAGIKVKQNGVQLYSPFFNVGAGLEVNNGKFKIVWGNDGLPYYQMHNGISWIDIDDIPPKFFFQCYDLTSGGAVTNSKGYWDRDAVFSKLQLKRINGDYVEIEQEFQFSDGTITAVQWFINRGFDHIQYRVRSVNRYMDYFTLNHYLKKSLAKSYTANGTTTAITSTTNTYVEILSDPVAYITLDEALVGANHYAGYVNPNKTGTWKVHWGVKAASTYVLFYTRHSWNEPINNWSEPVMFFQGASTNGISQKREQAGYLIKADSQVVHRSHVY